MKKVAHRSRAVPALSLALALGLATTGPVGAQEREPPHFEPPPGDHGGFERGGFERGGPDRGMPGLAERTEAISDLLDRLAEVERPEHDASGYPVRRGEVSALDLAPAALSRLESRGYRVIGRDPLPTLGHEIVRLAVPAGLSAREGAAAIAAADPSATIDLVHYYALEPAGGKPHRVHGERGKTAPVPGSISGKPVIGMIDTAVTPHPALAAARIIAWDQGNRPGLPVGHGTAVASIIAEGGQPTIYAANIFRGSLDRPFTSADVVAQALEWLLARDVPVINMSLAGPRNALLDRLIGEAIARGRTIVAAAGNGGPTAPPAYPAALPGVIAVTAVDHAGHIYRFANRGPYVSFAASGVDVVAANAPGGMARFTGTSFATAHVAALYARCRGGGASSSACTDRLAREAHDLGAPGRDAIYGYGFLD
ncbi:S8 family serine peptidase [Novosphingobium nitrogenifigens]|nr:S8 family serine peptidase [Novosphingobium nitrogenifigens]